MQKRIQPFSLRVLSRLAQALTQEIDPWLRDDIQIARWTVLYAARGEAEICGPHVLASYQVLGLHPEKVWPAIQARSLALGPLCAAPKKPPQSIKLWRSENTLGVRAANSHAGIEQGSPRTTDTDAMATASIAALYPNSDAPSSAKKRGFTYEEMLAIVEFSGAPHSIRQGTLSALKARGRWPNEDGPVTGVICVSLIGMMFHGVCCRSTARWRARRACALGYWRELRGSNSWADCPKCGAKRRVGTCGNCGYVGRAKTPDGKPNYEEFSRPYMYEINIDKFRTALRCRELRHFNARTYQEYRQAPKPRDEHPNVTEMPTRKAPQPTQPEKPLPPAPEAPLPEKAKPAAELPATTQLSARIRSSAKLVMEMCGLPEIGGGLVYVEAAVLAESKFSGMEIEDAAKHVAECALRDQRKGVVLTRFYFRDAKWRSNGGQNNSASSERSERSKRNILDGLLANARPSDAPDGPEREE
jgi:hypothetical protein